MKIGEFIQRVEALYNKGPKSDDSRLSKRLIYNKMISTRAKLIYQKANKKQKLSQWNYQTLPCVELVKAAASECPCLPAVGCEILKTKYPLPKPLISLGAHLIQSVTSLDGSVLYSEVAWSEYKFKQSNKYTSLKPDYFIKNEYLFITHRRGPKVITITGIFEDPSAVFNYPSYCDEDCKDCKDCEDILEKDFSIDNDLIDILIEMTIQELLTFFAQGVPRDNTNNSRDDMQTER